MEPFWAKVIVFACGVIIFSLNWRGLSACQEVFKFPSSLEKKVKDIVHKAFWDCLESELNNDPPEYKHAIRLLQEIREVSDLSFGYPTREVKPLAHAVHVQCFSVFPF